MEASLVFQINLHTLRETIVFILNLNLFSLAPLEFSLAIFVSLTLPIQCF